MLKFVDPSRLESLKKIIRQAFVARSSLYFTLFRTVGSMGFLYEKFVTPLLGKQCFKNCKQNKLLRLQRYFTAFLLVQCNLVWINALWCLKMRMEYLCFVALKHSNSRRQHGPNVISTKFRVTGLCSHPGSVVCCLASDMFLPSSSCL